MTVLLALDISAAGCGVATGAVEDGPQTMVRRLRAPTSGGKGAEFQEFLGDMIASEGPGIVVLEAPLMVTAVPRSAETARLLIGLAHSAEVVCAARGVQCERVSVQTWRKAILGKGNLRRAIAKKQALDFCAALGWPTGGSDDRAEAACIWAYGHLMWGARRAIRAALDRQRAIVFTGGEQA